MNYQKIHDDLVEYCKTQEVPEGTYTEKHHVIPRSCGGTDDPDNLLVVTARQHFMLHALLYFAAKRAGTIEERQALGHAWNLMRANARGQQRYQNSRLFEAARKDMSARMSKLQSGSLNSQYGTMWITNGYTNKKKKKDAPMPEGFWKGRYSNGAKYDPEVPYKHEKFNCIICNTEFIRKVAKAIVRRKQKCDACLSNTRTPLLYLKAEEFIELLDSGMSGHKACQALGKKYKTKMASYGLSGQMTKHAKEVLQKADRADLLRRIK